MFVRGAEKGLNFRALIKSRILKRKEKTTRVTCVIFRRTVAKLTDTRYIYMN